MSERRLWDRTYTSNAARIPPNWQSGVALLTGEAVEANKVFFAHHFGIYDHQSFMENLHALAVRLEMAKELKREAIWTVDEYLSVLQFLLGRTAVVRWQAPALELPTFDFHDRDYLDYLHGAVKWPEGVLGDNISNQVLGELWWSFQKVKPTLQTKVPLHLAAEQTYAHRVAALAGVLAYSKTNLWPCRRSLEDLRAAD